MKTIVDMIRHGEPVGGKKYRGWLDDPLSEKGWTQMRDAVGDHCPWEVIISSPLSRCSDFAREVASRHGLSLEIEPRLKELGFGDWEGCTAQELLARDPEILTRFWSDPVHNTPPRAETLAEFQERIVPAWRDLLARHAGKHALVVAHAGTIRMVLRHILDMPVERMFRIQVENASLTRVEVEAHEGMLLPRLMFHGGRL